MASVQVLGSGAAGPDYLVTNLDGSSYYVEEKSMSGNTANTRPTNLVNALKNFDSNGAPPAAASQLFIGQAGEAPFWTGHAA